jgi:lipopolysaccharide export system permease protein
LILTNGQRLESENGKSTLKISDFEEYGSNTGGTVQVNSDAVDAKLLAIPVLLKAPTSANLSELAWRLGLGLAAVNFVILAVALATVNPRGGRSANLVFVVLTFLVYNNLVNLGQSWVYGGAISFEGLLLLLHGGVLLLGLLWLGKRNNNWTLRSALRKLATGTRLRSSP